MNIEQKMKNENKAFAWNTVGIVLFVLVLLSGFVIGVFLLKLRPKESVLEKRELTKFPEFSMESFLDGSYTSEIETWFADTFPFREKLLTAEQNIKLLYGVQKDSINNIGDGDEIPDIEELIESMEAEQETETPYTEPATEVASQETEESEEETQAPETTAPIETVDGGELAKMNPQEAGAVNVKDLVGYCVYGFNLKGADTYCENVASVAEAMKSIGNTKVYDILIPDNSAIMLDDETKAAWKLSDEKKVIQYYQAKMNQLSSSITHVNLFDTLSAHNSEYLYFYTDHHWTALGAYYAYVELCKAKGIEPHALSEYEEVVVPNFLGSYYSASGLTQLEGNPDTVHAYVPISTNLIHFYDTSIEQMREGKIIRNLSGDEFLPTQRYLTFIYGDNPYSYIENPNLNDGSVCIVVKESFGNTFVPFLADHYQKVIIIDYRGYKESVIKLAMEEKAQDIIFINNLEAISDKPTMDVLGNICK